MSFKILGGEAEPDRKPGRERGPEPGRVLAPGAPPSPGPLPLELAEQLRVGEAVIWWDVKDRIDPRPIAIVTASLLAILGAASLVVPEFWSLPFEGLWPPLAALASPVALLMVRETLNRRATIVTDTSVIDAPRRGRMDRLAFDNIVRVRRDMVLGGIRLEGKAHRVRIPPSLAEDARQAIAGQRQGRFQDVADPVDDPLAWLP